MCGANIYSVSIKYGVMVVHRQTVLQKKIGMRWGSVRAAKFLNLELQRNPQCETWQGRCSTETKFNIVIKKVIQKQSGITRTLTQTKKVKQRAKSSHRLLTSFIQLWPSDLARATLVHRKMALYSDIVEREVCKKYFPDGEGVLKVKGMQDSPIANYSGMSKAVDIPVQTWSGEDSPLITCWKEANTWINTIFQLCVFSHVCILEVNELKVKQTTYNHPLFIFWWSFFFKKHSYTLPLCITHMCIIDSVLDHLNLKIMSLNALLYQLQLFWFKASPQAQITSDAHSCWISLSPGLSNRQLPKIPLHSVRLRLYIKMAQAKRTIHHSILLSLRT